MDRREKTDIYSLDGNEEVKKLHLILEIQFHLKNKMRQVELEKWKKGIK